MKRKRLCCCSFKNSLCTGIEHDRITRSWTVQRFYRLYLVFEKTESASLQEAIQYGTSSSDVIQSLPYEENAK
ncbi:hypothetical protein [Stenomitos frigidus]|uniref:hypothetical protein n=1 Tax=Stenomitos frigidus TaxID=1886765 RepID=UPI0011B22B96|nr:hypothetical protein [Stenomitos frigidus]